VICPECRTDNIEGTDFCENCGHDLRGLDQPDSPVGRGPEFIYDRLADLPHKAPVSVLAGDPVGLAVRRMQDENIGCVLVLEGSQLAGILTTWDVLHKVAGGKADLNAVSCRQVMTADPVFLRDNDNIAVAINKMSIGGFRHIPLLQGGTPTAVVSVTDVFRHIAPHLA